MVCQSLSPFSLGPLSRPPPLLPRSLALLSPTIVPFSAHLLAAPRHSLGRPLTLSLPPLDPLSVGSWPPFGPLSVRSQSVSRPTLGPLSARLTVAPRPISATPQLVSRPFLPSLFRPSLAPLLLLSRWSFERWQGCDVLIYTRETEMAVFRGADRLERIIECEFDAFVHNLMGN